MDAGTVTLVIYLAGLSHSWFELERMIPRATAPFAKAYPLAVQFSDKFSLAEERKGTHIGQRDSAAFTAHYDFAKAATAILLSTSELRSPS